MATKAFCPKGTVIAFALAGTPSTYDQIIGEVNSIDKSAAKQGSEDATNFASPSNYKEFVATVKDGGDYNVAYNFIPGDAGQSACSALFESGATVNWKITLPGTKGSFTFAAFIEEYGNFKFSTDKKATGDLKLKVTGPVTENLGS